MNKPASSTGEVLRSVWVICKYGAPKAYGASSKPYRTAKFLSENGVNTYLITSDSNHLARYPHSTDRYNWEKCGRLNHIWIRTLRYKDSASTRRILSWLAFEWHLFRLDRRKLAKPDVVIVSSLSLLTVLYGIYLKRIYRCRLVFEVRDIYPLTLTEELGVSSHHPLVWALKWIERIGYKNADLIVGTMPNLSRHVKDVLRCQKEVFYSPLGINDSWNGSIKPSSRVDEFFPERDCIIVGYAGSIGKTNALDCFIRAIQTLKDDTSLHFVIVGSGDLKHEYENRLAGYPNVTIGPRIEQSEVPYFLSKCDILYLSTHDSKVWDYGQSMNKLVDYMMAGKPVVASYRGFPSMLNEADSGVFVDTNSVDAIIQGIKGYASLDLAARRRIGERGRTWIVENCSNRVVCGRYMAKLQGLLKDGEV